MPLSLHDLLADPTLADADPVIHAGHKRMSTPVRWVHTSEVLDIAQLLRGGELLLVGGASLADATADQRRTYIAELAERGVAGLALETGTRLSKIPAEMIDEARRLAFPLIELHAVVRFVEVTQAVNGTLINASVRQFQLADRVSHALAAGLAEGADIVDLLATLARVVRAHVTLVTPAGELIAEAGGDAPAGTPQTLSDAVTAPVSSSGVTVAMLTMTPAADSDLLMLHAARDRAPEALGLALLRWRPLSQVERNCHEFLTIAVRGTRSPRRLIELAETLGIGRHTAWLGVVARVPSTRGATVGLHAALQRAGRSVVSEITQERYVAVVALDLGDAPLATACRQVLQDLRDSPLSPQLRVAVGPGTRDLTAIGRCLRESQAALDLHDDQDHEVLVDALSRGVPRFLAAVNRPALVADLIDEQLGDLLASDRRRGSKLFETLAMFLRQAGRKTDTAAALHLQRQSLYQRLDRIYALLGHPEPGSPRWASIALAVEFEQARRSGAAGT
jgi:purine catabolism regulator